MSRYERFLGPVLVASLLIAGCRSSDPKQGMVGDPLPPTQPTATLPPEFLPPPSATEVLPTSEPESTLPPVIPELPTPETIQEQPFFYLGVDIMKMSKDTLWDPPSYEEKQLLISRAQELGVTHVNIPMPVDTPEHVPNNATEQIREWVTAVREQGLSVGHRYMFTTQEGIYDQPKDPSRDYVVEMQQWMIENEDLIQPGDAWIAFPEPQNYGVAGLNCEPSSQDCFFPSVATFNEFLRNHATVTRATLNELGKPLPIICCGFDAYVTSGNNNPDWEGHSFIEPETLQVFADMGVTLGIDHYPQPHYDGSGRRTYAEDLAQIEETLPGLSYVLTEVGHPALADAESIESMFTAFTYHANQGNLKGVVYWPFNPTDLQEGLLQPDYSPNELFADVQAQINKLEAATTE